ncbi:tRNA methyltransferase 10 homolog B-like isoform X2 [Anneissia japonica]|uniref:tRNA methyltransferase 10 homolog B-like isoform X2 n=1 Tax=Anneissia japonica TaxID=1529436 RepID=UPI0014258D84|nr:tRNA methyltransferase 10 homolog B-like isoform X2 [Anneissia japonica]
MDVNNDTVKTTSEQLEIQVNNDTVKTTSEQLEIQYELSCEKEDDASAFKDETCVSSQNALSDHVDSDPQMSKKSIKKQQNHEQYLARKQAVRAEKRKAKRERIRNLRQTEGQESTNKLPKKIELKQKRKRLADALTDGQRVCIDLSMSAIMSSKEISKLAQQLGRVYGANKKAEKPMHLILAGLELDSDIHKACVQKNDGFNNYLIEKSEKPLLEMFALEEVVYLSPDSDQVLEVLDDSKVYVIGGLVDENPIKSHTLNHAKQCKLATARLPIDEYMHRQPNGTHSKILAVNQVFEILLNFHNEGDWRKALVAGVPKRKGFIIKTSEGSPVCL